MPGVDRGCTTHHHACDCREEAFRRIEEALWDLVFHAIMPDAGDSSDMAQVHAQKIRRARMLLDLHVLITRRD